MRSASLALAALSLLALTGCPREAEDASTADASIDRADASTDRAEASAATPDADSPPSEREDVDALPPAREDADPRASERPGADRDAAPPARDRPGPDSPAPAPGIADLTLRVGELQRLTADVKLGAGGFLDADTPTPLARLSVCRGPFAAALEVSAGQRVHVGPRALDVVRVDPRAGEVGLRWVTRPAPGEPRESIPGVAADVSGALHLEEMSFVRLTGGEVVAVGNLLRSEDGATITVSIFPRDYASDPSLGFDFHRRVGVGQALTGKVRRLRILALTPGAGDAPGEVVLGL